MGAEGRDTLQLGFVGCGWVAENRHLPALSRLPHLRVEAVADVDRARAERVAERFGVARAYVDPLELIGDPGVDAVAVCVPAAAHAAVALPALDAGKHLFVEKPLALTLDDADLLVERGAHAPVTSMVGFNLRSHRLIDRARSFLDDGRLGRVTAIVTAFTDARIVRPDVQGWRLRRDLGGGGLVEKLSHHFDLWRLLLRDEVDEVFALTQGEDEVTMVTGRMRGGALAHAVSSDRTGLGNTVTLYGEDGALQLDLYRFDGFEHRRPADLPGSLRARVRRALASPSELARNLGDIRRGGAYTATYEAEWRTFADAVRSGTNRGASLEDGRAALRVLLAAAASASRGEPVPLDDTPRTLEPAGPAVEVPQISA